MKTVLGCIIVAAGIAIDLYVGLWLCFVGGIMQVIRSAHDGSGLGVLLGMMRFGIS